MSYFHEKVLTRKHRRFKIKQPAVPRLMPVSKAIFSPVTSIPIIQFIRFVHVPKMALVILQISWSVDLHTNLAIKKSIIPSQRYLNCAQLTNLAIVV